MPAEVDATLCDQPPTLLAAGAHAVLLPQAPHWPVTADPRWRSLRCAHSGAVVPIQAGDDPDRHRADHALHAGADMVTGYQRRPGELTS
jgi:hypothetical protein